MIDRLNDRLESFLENNTYTWIRDISKFNFNGYVKKIEEKKFLFLDDELGEIWFNKEDIIMINFSKKERSSSRNEGVVR